MANSGISEVSPAGLLQVLSQFHRAAVPIIEFPSSTHVTLVLLKRSRLPRPTRSGLGMCSKHAEVSRGFPLHGLPA